MIYPDIHTHTMPGNEDACIYNCGTASIAGRRISAGIHPWHVTERWNEEFAAVRRIAAESNCAAIGECGIDKVNAAAPVGVQEEAFRAHALLAEEHGKPLIIHCVKGMEEIIALHKDMKPKQAWIIHGFRGKPQQAAQLLKAGLYLSFGERYNEESLRTTPVDRMFIESDESTAGIGNIYGIIAQSRGCSVEELAASIMENTIKCNMHLL